MAAVTYVTWREPILSSKNCRTLTRNLEIHTAPSIRFYTLYLVSLNLSLCLKWKANNLVHSGGWCLMWLSRGHDMSALQWILCRRWDKLPQILVISQKSFGWWPLTMKNFASCNIPAFPYSYGNAFPPLSPDHSWENRAKYESSPPLPMTSISHIIYPYWQNQKSHKNQPEILIMKKKCTPRSNPVSTVQIGLKTDFEKMHFLSKLANSKLPCFFSRGHRSNSQVCKKLRWETFVNKEPIFISERSLIDWSSLFGSRAKIHPFFFGL